MYSKQQESTQNQAGRRPPPPPHQTQPPIITDSRSAPPHANLVRMDSTRGVFGAGPPSVPQRERSNTDESTRNAFGHVPIRAPAAPPTSASPRNRQRKGRKGQPPPSSPRHAKKSAAGATWSRPPPVMTTTTSAASASADSIALAAASTDSYSPSFSISPRKSFEQPAVPPRLAPIRDDSDQYRSTSQSELWNNSNDQGQSQQQQNPDKGRILPSMSSSPSSDLISTKRLPSPMDSFDFYGSVQQHQQYDPSTSDSLRYSMNESVFESNRSALLGGSTRVSSHRIMSKTATTVTTNSNNLVHTDKHPLQDQYIQQRSSTSFQRDSSASQYTPSFVSSNEDDQDVEKRIGSRLQLTVWYLESLCVRFLTSDVQVDALTGQTYYPEDRGGTSLPSVLRKWLYDPACPEFTTLQLFVWACLIGVFMGVYTAFWKMVISNCIDFMWVRVPGQLRLWGFFTDLDGWFPLPHYMWICPTIFAGFLSWVFASLTDKIPGQDDWISALHKQGILEHKTFLNLWVLSTASMASGLSLGPELPLVLTAGMVGSWVALQTGQSMLSSRCMNLTAASAAIGGFFGFPMAGAMFILELPHRMGMQFFEALSPATISSIVSVLVNRIVTKDDVTGYFHYPFLTDTLPSQIFTSAFIYGLIGCAIGIFYAKAVLKLKKWVHDWFHEHHHPPAPPSSEEGKGGKEKPRTTTKTTNLPSTTEAFANDPAETTWDESGETTPLNGVEKHLKHGEGGSSVVGFRGIWANISGGVKSFIQSGGVISKEPRRAAAAGALAGFLSGVLCMLLPQLTFWGEEQLQNLIDKGETILPIFGKPGDLTADLTAWGHCLFDQDYNESGQVGCYVLLAVGKIATTGLSLGTGCIAGHFWGPLFVGVAAAHFLTELFNNVSWLSSLAAYPCVVILCLMGSVHVVTFRAHIAIMLILTLTISGFDPEGGGRGASVGDYSAVFPLLVVAVFVSLMASRDVRFYKSQRNRGDIVAKEELFYRPNEENFVIVPNPDFDGEGRDYDEILFEELEGEDDEILKSPPRGLTQDDIEAQFKVAANNQGNVAVLSPTPSSANLNESVSSLNKGLSVMSDVSDDMLSDPGGALTPNSQSSRRLDELLAIPFEKKPLSSSRRSQHRATRSLPDADFSSSLRLDKQGSSGNLRSHRRLSSNTSTGSQSPLIQVKIVGKIEHFEPDIMDQARSRSRTSSLHRRLPSLPRVGGSTPLGSHSRRNANSQDIAPHGDAISSAGGLTMDDIEQAMSQMQFLPTTRPPNHPSSYRGSG